MRKVLLAMGVGVLAFTMALATADARGGRGPGRSDGEGRGMRGGPPPFLAELALDDVQRAAIDGLRVAHLQQVDEIRAARRAVQDELHALVQRPEATVAEVEALDETLDELHRALRAERRRHHQAVYETLDAEQRAAVPNAWRLGVRPRKGDGPLRGRGACGEEGCRRGAGPGRGEGAGAGMGRGRSAAAGELGPCGQPRGQGRRQ